MSPSPEREARTQAERLHAAGQMTPGEIVQLQDDLAWWKDHAASLSADVASWKTRANLIDAESQKYAAQVVALSVKVAELTVMKGTK